MSESVEKRKKYVDTIFSLWYLNKALEKSANQIKTLKGSVLLKSELIFENWIDERTSFVAIGAEESAEYGKVKCTTKYLSFLAPEEESEGAWFKGTFVG